MLTNHPSFFQTLNLSDLTFPFRKSDIICVKEDLLRKSPNSLTRTFLNANIPRLRPNSPTHSKDRSNLQ